MARFVTVQVSLDERTIPVPPVDIEFRPIDLPTIGPVDFPNIEFGPFEFPLPNIEIPEFSFKVPTVFVGLGFESIPDLGPFPIPEVDLPELFIATRLVTIPGIDFTIRVVDPFGSRLIGGDVTLTDFILRTPGTIPVPSVDVGEDTLTVGGQVILLQDIRIPALRVLLPDIPEFDLPSFGVVSGIALTGEVAVPDPSSVRADVTVDAGAIRAFALEPVPEWVLSADPSDLLDVVLTAAERNVTAGLARRLRGLAEGLAEVVLSAETKQELRERARE